MRVKESGLFSQLTASVRALRRLKVYASTVYGHCWSELVIDPSFETSTTLPTLGTVRFRCLRTTDADLLYTFFQMLGPLDPRLVSAPHAVDVCRGAGPGGKGR